MKQLCSVNLGVEGVLLDTADTDAVGEGKSYVARLSPGTTPGVSDDESIGGETNSGDSVVELSAAAVVSANDTTSVVHEDVGLSAEGHGDGTV